MSFIITDGTFIIFLHFSSPVFSFCFLKKNVDILVIFYTFTFFTIPTLCVLTWIENFNEDCKEDDYDACLHYEKLSEVFSTFLFLFYSFLQFLIIIVIFSSMVKFISEDSLTIYTLIRFTGNSLAIGKRSHLEKSPD